MVTESNIRIKKIASKSTQVIDAFLPERPKKLKELDLGVEPPAKPLEVLELTD